MQRGDESTRERVLAKRRGGNTALGILILLLAYLVYPTNNFLAIGVGLLGVYLILGGRF